MTFAIETPALSRHSADRSEDLRDPDRVRAAWSHAQVIEVDAAGRVDVDDAGPVPVLRRRPAAAWGDAPPADAVLLGRLSDSDRPDHLDRPQSDAGPAETDIWAMPVSNRRTVGLRDLGALLGDVDAGLLTTAVALLTWHAAAGFCPRCGRPTTPRPAGWSRSCSAGHEQFPRTDPAVIMLVHDGEGRMVLARQPSWPAGRVSVLAGFVEAGEALEATVLREVAEEVGLTVRDPQYLGSQPWPFPRSLMVGFVALAEPGAVLRPRAGEIESARWVDRATVRAVLAAGGETDDIGLPGAVSIARKMIEGWAAQQD